MHNKGRTYEKSKDFFGAIKRLFKELSNFKIFIIISLILAASSSILSIISPNQLSKLTDEITLGLVPKQKTIEKVMTNIQNSFESFNIEKIIKNESISSEDKQVFLDIISNLNINKKTDLISRVDKIPKSIMNIILPDFKIDNTNINTYDQVAFLKTVSKVKNTTDKKEIYSKIDEFPSSIKKIIKPSIDMYKVKKIVFFIASIYILSSLFSLIQSLIMTTVSNNFARKLRTNISTKINKLPLKFFDKNQVGDILSRVTNDVDTVGQNMNQSLSILVSSSTLFIGTIIMMFVTNYIMAITAILSSFIGFIFMFLILSKSQKYFNARQRELGKLNSHIEEIYSGLLVVKAYNGKKKSDEKFDELNQNVYIANKKSQFLSGLMPPLMNFIGNFGYVAVCIVGALLTMNNIITFGVIVAFMTYVRLFTSPLSQMAQAFTSLQSITAASERIFEFLDEEEQKETGNKIVLEKDKVKGDIEFDHVKFGYDENKIIIKDFNAKIKAGQKVAIVGPTGAGKTTMVNLLMKFYDIKSGDIKIDNVSIKDISRENIHSLWTMVLQDTWLFKGTIRENIVYNRENVSKDKIKEVCDIVGLTHFIKTLPNGFDTELFENDSISVGQKQLLTIARGMIENAPFLILDEATSNVDTRTEQLVQKAMDKLMQGRTSFIIAHRLSTIKNADLILVMNEGNIVETGKHDDLIKKHGFYEELYNSQFDI